MIMKGNDTDHDVIKATAALKGMLGIGNDSTRSTDDAFPSSSVPNESGEATSSEKRKKTKKKNSKAKQGGGEAERKSKQAGPAPRTDKRVATLTSSTPEIPIHSHPAVSSKKKNKPKQKKESENYAWSAFQSSPDACKLPIPAFYSTPSPVAGNELVSTEVTSPDVISADVISTDAILSDNAAANVVLANLISADAVSAYAALTDNISSIGTFETIRTKAKDTTKKQLSEDSCASERDHCIDSEVHSAHLLLNGESNGVEKKLSGSPMTGVNLAAALVSGSSFAEDQGRHTQPMNPHQSLSLTYGPEFGMAPQIYPYHQVPQYSMPSPTDSPAFLSPQPHRMSGPPPPPPGYMTIQVQTPPVLMPGRQMIVTSPAGYPLQVIVPEGIPPGMVIPVHVPVGPHLHHMLQSPPTPSYNQFYNPHPPH